MKRSWFLEYAYRLPTDNYVSDAAIELVTDLDSEAMAMQAAREMWETVETPNARNPRLTYSVQLLCGDSIKNKR